MRLRYWRGSTKRSKSRPKTLQTNHLLKFQPSIVHTDPTGDGFGHVPVALATLRMPDRRWPDLAGLVPRFCS